MKITKLDISMIIGITVAILVSAFTVGARKLEQLEKDVLRLHILANSDSGEDQQLKLQVRDRLMEEFDKDFSQGENIQQAQLIAKQNLAKYQQITEELVVESGYDYGVTAEISQVFFPLRVYENYALPSGNYQAVVIKIGAAKGENWWCLMYPSLCLPAVSERTTFTTEESHLVEKENHEVRFAVYDFFKGIFAQETKQQQEVESELKPKEITATFSIFNIFG